MGLLGIMDVYWQLLLILTAECRIFHSTSSVPFNMKPLFLFNDHFKIVYVSSMTNSKILVLIAHSASWDTLMPFFSGIMNSFVMNCFIVHLKINPEN